MTTEELCKNPIFRHFRMISDIPHGSFNEKELSDVLYRWALEMGLEAEQDAVNNVFIRKPASPGYETVPAILFQAHIDMVCEKAEGCEHDFEKDPIHWEIDGDVLSTGGRTTLGADDGAGVAIAMTLLTDEELEHPELEVLFTVAEEADFSGAETFDTKKLHARRLVNLDHAAEAQVVCGSCGGMRADLMLAPAFVKVPEGWNSYRLVVEGLRGGHSGEDIHRGRGSANAFLARTLHALQGVGEFLLTSMKGGTFRLAISREAEAVFWIPCEKELEMMALVESLEKSFRQELAVTAESLQVTVVPCEAAAEGMSPEKIVAAMMLCPDGIQQMNEKLTGVVDTSNNMGELYLDPENGFHIVSEIRSLRDSLKEAVYQRMEILAELLGMTCSTSVRYHSWNYQPDSELFRQYREAAEQCGGPKMEVISLHAGLEVASFYATCPELDAISIGPDCRNFHSPGEEISISSTKRMYGYLKQFLSNMKV